MPHTDKNSFKDSVSIQNLNGTFLFSHVSTSYTKFQKKPDKSGPRYNEQPPVDSVRRRIHKSIENKSFFCVQIVLWVVQG